MGAMARPVRVAKPSFVQSHDRDREGPGSAFAAAGWQLDSASAPVAQLDRASVYGTEGRDKMLAIAAGLMERIASSQDSLLDG